jgi:hypothetical protein
MFVFHKFSILKRDDDVPFKRYKSAAFLLYLRQKKSAGNSCSFFLRSSAAAGVGEIDGRKECFAISNVCSIIYDVFIKSKNIIESENLSARRRSCRNKISIKMQKNSPLCLLISRFIIHPHVLHVSTLSCI